MASIRRHPTRSDRWQVRWRDPTGRERSKAFTSNRDARAWAAQVEADLLRGAYFDPEHGQAPFAEYAGEWMAGRLNLRESTRVRDGSYLRNLILPTFGPHQLSAITPRMIRAWVSDLSGRGKAPATIAKAYQLLSAALRSAVDDDLLARSPARGVKLPKAERPDMRVLDAAQVARLAEAIAPRYRAMVYVGAYGGLRFGETVGLRTASVDLLHRKLQVTHQLTEVAGKVRLSRPKTDASIRSITMPRVLAAELGAHIEVYPPGDGGFLFTSSGHHTIRRTNWRRREWLTAVEASVGAPLRFHDLRHTHAALLIAQGAHPKVIQSRLGHTSIRTTMDIYGHLLEGLDEDAADRLDVAHLEASERSDVDQVWNTAPVELPVTRTADGRNPR